MALSGSKLKSQLLDALDLPSDLDETTRKHIEDRAEKLANSIIDYITTNGVINTTVTGVCPSGGGPLVAGKGIGTIS